MLAAGHGCVAKYLAGGDAHLSRQQLRVDADAEGIVSVTRLAPNPSYLQRANGVPPASALAAPLRAIATSPAPCPMKAPAQHWAVPTRLDSPSRPLAHGAGADSQGVACRACPRRHSLAGKSQACPPHHHHHSTTLPARLLVGTAPHWPLTTLLTRTAHLGRGPPVRVQLVFHVTFIVGRYPLRLIERLPGYVSNPPDPDGPSSQGTSCGESEVTERQRVHLNQ